MEVALAHYRTTFLYLATGSKENHKNSHNTQPYHGPKPNAFSVRYVLKIITCNFLYICIHMLYEINSKYKVSVLTPHNVIIKHTLLHFTCNGKANKIACTAQKLTCEIRTINPFRSYIGPHLTV
jgi:hypothetical protein